MCVKNVQVIARGSKHALIGPGMRERLRAMVGYFGSFCRQTCLRLIQFFCDLPLNLNIL